MPPEARYDSVADFYETFAPDRYDDPAMLALLRLLGDVGGLSVLDMACGHGRLTRELARRGANVTGVDLSIALLDKARAAERAMPAGITYIHADAANASLLGAARFDVVTCSFGLSDIDDLAGVAASVARVLRPGGRFVFSIIHPCFPGWPSKGSNPSWQPGHGYYAEELWYASSPPHGIRPRVGANHRMLSTYVTLFADQGLFVDGMAEPPPPPDWMAAVPAVGPVPIYLVARMILKPVHAEGDHPAA